MATKYVEEKKDDEYMYGSLGADDSGSRLEC